MAGKKKVRAASVPRSEWVFAILGAVVVLASLAILLHSAATSRNSPPRLSARVASIQPSGDQFLVMIEVVNEGGSTAADARIEAELRQSGGVAEKGEATIDFVAPRSTRRAGILFSHEPRAGEVVLRASGYREP